MNKVTTRKQQLSNLLKEVDPNYEYPYITREVIADMDEAFGEVPDSLELSGRSKFFIRAYSGDSYVEARYENAEYFYDALEALGYTGIKRGFNFRDGWDDDEHTATYTVHRDKVAESACGLADKLLSGELRSISEADYFDGVETPDEGEGWKKFNVDKSVGISVTQDGNEVTVVQDTHGGQPEVQTFTLPGPAQARQLYGLLSRLENH